MPVRWYGRQFQALLDGAEERILRKAAFQCEAHAKVNIAANDQIDTGFMMNTAYVATPREDTYGQTKADGEYAGAKTGQAKHVEKAPKRSVSGAKAIVAFAANYAIFQELSQPFLFKALEQTEKELPQIIHMERIK